MWMNKNTHINIIFEKEDYVEFIYPPAENRKSRNPDLLLLPFGQTHKHTQIRLGNALEKKIQAK